MPSPNPKDAIASIHPKVGIIGAGGMAKRHGAAYMQMKDVCTVQAVHDFSAEYGGMVAANCQAEYIDSYEEILECVDVVDVCMPTPWHLQYVSQALQAGKHVICEKPMALSVAECRQMIELAEENNRLLYPAHVLRFFPDFAAANRAIRSGQIGTPQIVCTRRGGDHPRSPIGWYADPKLSGGVMMDLIIHDFDWLRWTFGEVAEVSADSLTYRGLDHLDYAFVTLRFESGVLAFVEGSWADPGGFNIEFEATGSSGQFRFGNKDTAVIELSSRTEAMGVKKGISLALPTTSINSYEQELRHFVAILNGAEPMITAYDGLKAVQIAQAAQISVQTGRPVNPAEVE